MDDKSLMTRARADVALVSLSDRRRAEAAEVRRLIVIGSLLAESARRLGRDSPATSSAAALADLWELQLITARPALVRAESESKR